MIFSFFFPGALSKSQKMYFEYMEIRNHAILHSEFLCCFCNLFVLFDVSPKALILPVGSPARKLSAMAPIFFETAPRYVMPAVGKTQLFHGRRTGGFRWLETGKHFLVFISWVWLEFLYFQVTTCSNWVLSHQNCLYSSTFQEHSLRTFST